MSTGIHPEDTRVVHGVENTICTIENALHKTRSRWDACVDPLTPPLSAGELREMYVKAQERGVTVRYITEITKDNLVHCKEMMKVAEVRHFAGIKGNFAVGDEEYVAGIREDDSNQLAHCIYSNVKQLVRHHRSIFEMFWQSAVPAESRVMEIEDGITLSVMEIIQNPQESLRRAYSKVKSAKEQVLIMFSTPNAMRRQLHEDRLQVIKEAAERNVMVKILVPAGEQVWNKVKEIKSKMPRVWIRGVDESLKTGITIVVVDRNESFIFETKNDASEGPYDAIGQSVHSTSKVMGLSFASIFESIWNQAELYEKLKEVGSMKDEFVNIAAHELRTPVLPIVLSAENLADRMPEDEDVKIIRRNATRITKLTNDILDVSRLENNTFRLRKEKADIKRLCEEAIQDAVLAMPDNKRQVVKMSFEHDTPEEVELAFDRERMRQVLVNLLDNAVKFTKGGTITVSINRSRNYRDHLEVRVTDTGSGIDKTIKDRLFEKFVTKSDTAGGSGLGLYLCKGIVEAHGGKIWAENNSNGKGAAFTFTLPLAESEAGSERTFLQDNT